MDWKEGVDYSGPLYAQPFFRRTAGKALRPGGARVTLRGLAAGGMVAAGGDAGQWKATRPDLRAVDIGCGAGATLALLHGMGFAVTGVEPSVAMRREAEEWLAKEISVVEGNAGAIPLPSGSQDVALCECVLSLVEDKAAALREIGRVLAPGGVLVWSDLCRRSKGGNGSKGSGGTVPGMERSGCMAGAVSPDEMSFLLEEAGFRPTLAEDHSRELRQLAGQLVFDGAGEQLAQWFGGFCSQSSGACGGKELGYILLTGIKDS